MTLTVQLLTMFVMSAGGFYLGMAHDTFRRLANRWHERQLIRYVTEIAFWMTQTLLLFYALFLVNNGQIRLYVLLACLLGYSAYRGLAAPIYQRVLEKVISAVNWVIRLIQQVFHVLIVVPLTALLRLIQLTIIFTLNVALAILSVLYKIISVPLKWAGRALYRILPSSVQKTFYTTAKIYSTIENTTTKIFKNMKNILNRWRS